MNQRCATAYYNPRECLLMLTKLHADFENLKWLMIVAIFR